MSEIPQVYQAIADVSLEMSKDGVTKTNKNTQQGYMFRGVDDVYNALAPILPKCGLVILPKFTERILVEKQTKSGGNLFYVTVKGEFDFVSVKDGSKHTIVTYGEAMDSADKATNKAMSAAYKYAAFQAFSIPTEGDNDADAHTPEPARKPQPTSTPTNSLSANSLNAAISKEDLEKKIKDCKEIKLLESIWKTYQAKITEHKLITTLTDKKKELENAQVSN